MNDIKIKNKKAYFEYEIIDKYIAGIQLTGTEIKSIRNGKASIKEAFCVFVKNELFIRNMFISEYDKGSYNNHAPKRDRKLLLNKQELNKLHKSIKTKGTTIVPLLLFINKGGLAKLEVALAKGKKLHDKREDIKEKDTKRDTDRLLKNYV